MLQSALKNGPEMGFLFKEKQKMNSRVRAFSAGLCISAFEKGRPGEIPHYESDDKKEEENRERERKE